MSDSRQAIEQALSDAQHCLTSFIQDEATSQQILNIAEVVCQAFQNQHQVYIAGNGGSHCDALHFAEEFTGQYRKARRALPAMALGEASHSTCVSNDYGFEQVFARQIEAFGKKGDVFIALSTSGNSQNLVEAVNKAKALGVITVGLLGKGGGTLKELVDQCMVVPGATSDRIQEIHMMVLHILIEAVERQLFPENYS